MKLMVLDGNSIINRAFFGLKALTTQEGLYTNGVLGFLNMLGRFVDEEQPDALCVAFDRKEPTFRHEADAAYKATRRKMPEELAQQMPVMKQVLSAMSIPCYDLVGYEADDLLGTIACRCRQRGWECVVVTGDRDSLQLITPTTRVKLVSSHMGKTITADMTEDTFRAQYGFDPIHMIDLKALMGDSSDNIPGVPGIGEKTAMALIQRYGSIDALYAAMPDVELKPSALRKLAEGEESARRSYWLATIVTDAPLEFDPEDALRQPFRPELYDLFVKLEFTKLIKKYGLTPAPTPEEQAAAAKRADYTVTVETAETDADATRLLALWRAAPHTAVYALEDLSVLAVTCDADDQHGVTAILRSDRFTGDWDGLLDALFSADIRKAAHNVKDLTYTLLERGLHAEGFVFDTALAAYLLDATAGSYDLPRLFVAYCGAELPPAAHLDPEAFSLLGDDRIAEASLCSYTSAVDALYQVLEPKLEALNMTALLHEMELPLCRVLAEMELTGFRIDGSALARLGQDLQRHTDELEQSIYDMVGHHFNINSPKQLGTVLFDELLLPHGKKTKTGWSTNAEVLEKLRYESPVVSRVLEFRQYAKLKSTYADGLLRAVSRDGRVRTRFQMTVTATGRLSSTEPNLQNIPTRTELGSEMRRVFIADEGNVLVDADYSQIELRLLAHMAGDEAMIEAFRSGQDFHTVTAAKVFHVPEAEVTHQMRSRAKAVNFGIVYGMSSFSLSQDLQVTMAEAKSYKASYFATYPGVKQYMTDIVAQGKAHGYVETLYHRRRALPELKAPVFARRAFGERVAMNMPIQGTAADIMKLAMLRVHDRLRREGLKAKLIMQVHDELIVECPEAERETVETLLRQEMEQVAALSVPLIADAHSGKNWLEAKG
mgnify:FL=1